jgi:hypothetical protein
MVLSSLIGAAIGLADLWLDVTHITLEVQWGNAPRPAARRCRITVSMHAAMDACPA